MPSSECPCCKARFIKFRLLADLSTTDYRQQAKVLAFWDGEDPTVEGVTFYVYNLVVKTENDDQPTEDQGPTEWAYAAPEGTTGYAILDEQNKIAGSGETVVDPPTYRIVEIPAAPLEIRAFELKEELTQFSGAKVQAYWRKWDPSANNGMGGFVGSPDCEVFYVADLREVGYVGVPGAKGAAEMRMGDDGPIGVICDLCCPGDEMPECASQGT